MRAGSLIVSLSFLLGALAGCDESPRSALAPTAPSLATTGDAIVTKTDAMQVKVDEFHQNGDIDNQGIATGLKKLLSGAGEAAMRDDLKATEKMMGALQNRVRAQRGKHIRDAAADELDGDAQEVIDLSTGNATPTEADLSVRLTAAPDPVAPGDNLTHTITLTNPGPANVTDVQVSLLVAGDVQPVSAPSECTSTVEADGLSYDCAVAALDAGTDATLSIAVVPQTGGETLSSQADIVTWTGADDADLTNNIATETTLVNTPPTAQLDLPLDASLFVQGEEITFAGAATDAEDGALTGSSLVWTSSLDGQIGTGESFTRSDLSAGTHAITLTAIDHSGATGSATVSVEVAALGTSQGGSLQWTRVLGAVTDVQIGLQDAWGTSGSDVWAVGIASGSRTAILHYDGSSWTEQPTGTTAGFLGVWGSSSSDVFFVGAGGTIRHFDGTDWSFHSSPTTAPLYDAWGSSGIDVWAVGAYTLLHYDGSAWTEKSTDYRLFSVWGSSSSDVWAVGPGAVLRYDGTTWEPQGHTFPSGQTLTSGGAPLAVWGSGSDVFIVGEYGKLLHYDASTDAWMQHARPGELENEAFYGVWGTSATDVYAVGSFGTVLHFDGSHWSRVRAGGPTLRSIWGSGGGDLFAVGAGATILHSTGSDWTVHSTGVSIAAIWGASATNVFAVGGGLILHYDGTAWSAQSSELTSIALPYGTLRGISGTSGSDVWAVGDGGLVLHYDGLRWTERRPYGSGAGIYSVWANTSDEVFAVGSSGTLLHYDGTAWTTQTSPVTSSLLDVHGASGSAVWAVGSGGAIVHYDGTSWSTQASGTAATLFGAWAAASNRALATGNILGVLHYDGTGWVEQPISGMHSGRGIWGASPTDIFAAPSTSGGIGKILHYDGSTWTAQDVGVGNVLFHDLWGSSATDVFAVGWGGTIVRGTP